MQNRLHQKSTLTIIRPSRTEHGFSLFELMVVVVLVGILAAFSIPAYINYTRRVKVTEGLLMASPAKIAVTEYALDLNKATISGANNAVVGVGPPSSFAGQVVNTISVEHNGIIRIEYRDDLGELNLVPLYNPETGRVAWSCHFAAHSAMATYAPKDCSAG